MPSVLPARLPPTASPVPNSVATTASMRSPDSRRRASTADKTVTIAG